jgi:hypothetical protein
MCEKDGRAQAAEGLLLPLTGAGVVDLVITDLGVFVVCGRIQARPGISRTGARLGARILTFTAPDSASTA